MAGSLKIQLGLFSWTQLKEMSYMSFCKFFCQILGCGFLGLNPLLSGPRNGFWSIFGHLIEFGLVAQLSKQPQNGFYKVNQDMGRKFKTARVGTPLHGIGSVKSTVLIRENPQFMWPA